MCNGIGGSRPIMSKKLAIILFVASLFFVLSCEDKETQPLYDGYTLHGSVRDSISGNGIPYVKILQSCSFEDTLVFDFYGLVTDPDGDFTYRGFPGTAPSCEIFRFEKSGYRTKDITVLEEAVQVADFRYKLEVLLTSE